MTQYIITFCIVLVLPIFLFSHEYDLKQNYPNPFNPSTTIEVDLPKGSVVNLKILNIFGEEAATLVLDRLSAGSYSYKWDANNLTNGVYLYRFQVGDYIETRIMILTKLIFLKISSIFQPDHNNIAFSV